MSLQECGIKNAPLFAHWPYVRCAVSILARRFIGKCRTSRQSW